jgi:hypothetical protein
MKMMDAKPRKTRLEQVCQAVETDLASSVRHWIEVLESSRLRMLDAGRSPQARSRAKRQFTRAEEALARLARGLRVAL